jgi:hypothetical protein
MIARKVLFTDRLSAGLKNICEGTIALPTAESGKPRLI